LEWLHNGEKLTADDRHVMMTVGNRAQLKIHLCSAGDAGEYCCQATNAVDTETCRAKLTVR
jgi:hypothetical protein